MQMAAGLDTGDMLHKLICPINPDDTGQSIHDRLANDGAKALLSVLDQICEGTLQPEKQDESLVTYAHKLTKAEAEIDWSKPALEIDRMIRAFNPWPAAYTTYQGKPLKLLMSAMANNSNSSRVSPGTVINETRDGIEIATGDGVLLLKRLQISGRKAMDVSEFLNGRSLQDVSLGK